MDDGAAWEIEARPARPWRTRRAVLLAVAALAVLALGGVIRFTGARGSDLRVTAPTPSAGGAEAGAPWQPRTAPTGVTLYLMSERAPIRLFDVDARRVVGEIAIRPDLGDHPFRVVRIGERVVVQAADGVVWAVGRGAGRRRLGAARLFVPAPPDRVWLVDGLEFGAGGGLRVSQVDLRGREVVAPTPVPPGRFPVAGQGNRVLLKDLGGVRWWDPRTGATGGVPGRQVLAVGLETTVVCSERCQTVDVLGTDGTRTARLRTIEPVASAVLSPDERAVALVTDTRDATAVLLVADLVSETLETIANGVWAPARSGGVVWNDDGTLVFMATEAGAIGIYDRTSQRTHVVDADVGQVDALAVAPAP